ncbi:hypothetical protein X772_35270 [Mesorhizobium sp. LSJC280B00]|nr:hypothetical protein X772_35270 [Mesorhizobium sp. LSJC280B00]
MLEAPPLAPVVAEIRARSEEAGLAAPSYLTVARRIPGLFSPEEIARKGPELLRTLSSWRARRRAADHVSSECDVPGAAFRLCNPFGKSGAQ